MPNASMTWIAWGKKSLGMALIIGGLSTSAWAAAREAVPEINPGMAMSAMALLGGGFLLISRRRSSK